MKRFIISTFAAAAIAIQAAPASADQSAIDHQAALQAAQQQQQQQQLVLQQQQQQQQQQYFAGISGVEPYCNVYGTCPVYPYGAGYPGPGRGLGVATLLPGLFDETPQAAPPADASPEADDAPVHRRHHARKHRAARQASRYR